ncbi:tumor necrosis factor ligand superfamily member 15-like [Carcharodon carcharias]|uniref:TNF superfamily member 31 n=1 Tax=Carcharodon carcharias TaxID=13397 RepID=UPI001B7DF69C|nr:TNF superfamily member 31 [Carcharodon carcharias]
MQKPTSTDPEDLTCRNSKYTPAGKHSCSSLLLTIIIILQWLAIAAMCYIVFFYINTLKETTGSETFKSSVVKPEKPIAHFTALAGFQNTSDHLCFEHRRGHAFKTSNMKYDEAGYLVIPTSGVYFIYAQVTFKCSQDCSKLSQQFSATISKKNNHYPAAEELLKSYAWPQMKDDDFLKISTYKAGAFQLYADDYIYVDVPKHLYAHISEGEYETYFGAFLLEPSTSV